jgi:GT2 family glycosyltransferase
MGRGLLARALRHCVRRLPGPARRAGARLLNEAPLPERVRRRLRTAVQPAGAGGAAARNGAGGYPAADDDPRYAAWVAQNDLTPQAADDARRRLAAFSYRPLVSVLLPVHDPEPEVLQLALRSVEQQLYPDWELCLVDDVSRKPGVAEVLQAFVAHRPGRTRLRSLARRGHIAGATNAALSLARGEFVAFLDHDDELTPDALLEMVAALQEDPVPDVVYSDHDVLGRDGRRRAPSFKPDWCPELLLSYMYLGHLKLYRTELVRAAGGLRAGFEGSADYDLALRLTERTDRIRHVPRILYHWRAAPGSMAADPANKPQSAEAGRKAVQDALDRRHIAGTARQPEFARRASIGVYKIDFAGTRDVPVTIIIPTRDRLELLRPCLESIETRTTHRAWEVLILDNESRRPETLDYLARSPHRVVRFENGGRFNFAAMANEGVRQARTELFVLLNNDTVVISPEWLEELVGYGRLPGVGAVGAKLLYPDGRIQHAGVILGTHGLTGHAFQPRPDNEDQIEYQAYAHVARNYLAVSAACMLSRRDAFRAVGGFNEHDLRVGWNDVDYCLRLREHGYRVVFDPYAVLHHLESQSRGDDKDPAEIRYMMRRWRRYVDRDPFYNPNLSCQDAEFRVKSDPAEERTYYYREYR